MLSTEPRGREALRRPALPDVVAEHLEEHGFLSLQRRKLLFSSEVPARRLADHDERIDAHWDGLVVNQPDSLTLAQEKLGADDPWERATAIRFWLTHARPSFDALITRWSEAPPEHAPSWREAMRGLDSEVLTTVIPPARRPSLPPFALAVVVDALGWQAGLDGSLARDASSHADTAVRSSFARHAHGLAAPLLERLFDDAEESVRRRALWSQALLDAEAGLDRARQRSRRPAPEPFAVRIVGLLGEPDDHARLVEAAATDTGRPAVFFAFADLGTPEAIESLIRLLTLPDPAVTLVVTEALETALGTIPRKAPDAPATPDEARRHAAPLVEALDGDARLLAGRAWPWRDEPADEPGLAKWRGAVSGRRGKARRGTPREGGASPELRRDVPDGFFEALPALDARPGE